MANRVVWIDIPVADLDRAIRFYSAILGAPSQKHEFPNGMTIGFLPHDSGDVGGCLVPGGDQRPSPVGPLVYLNVTGRLDDALAAVEPNGGKILQPRESIGQHGFRAIILDSEGNRFALHSS
ncbi:MAG TPA: VOC family protein [Terriglobia bacterium]|nr:VOC family protein [Terriglobia bacterium]